MLKDSIRVEDTPFKIFEKERKFGKELLEELNADRFGEVILIRSKHLTKPFWYKSAVPQYMLLYRGHKNNKTSMPYSDVKCVVLETLYWTRGAIPIQELKKRIRDNCNLWPSSFMQFSNYLTDLFEKRILVKEGDYVYFNEGFGLGNVLDFGEKSNI
jgi:hypothetical protein